MGSPDRLFDPDRAPQVDPADAVLVVHQFLERCVAWAEEQEMPKRIERMSSAPTPEHAAALHQWASWIVFVRHAQRELEAGTLDRWFVDVRSP
ncbi:MAG: hypothetical protein ABMA64_23465 [Myxococcota bacterium]